MLPLHTDAEGSETVTIERIDAGAQVPAYACDGGEEVFVLAGTLADEHGTYPQGTWIRNPVGHTHGLTSPNGCTVWVKRGHLRGL